MDSLKFGTSGLRGLAVDLEGGPAARYARAFLRHLGVTGGDVLVGRDLRESSARIAAAVASGIAAETATPVDCGEISSPALALAAISRGIPAIMVSGSHIPADRNGLKFFRPEGEITKADESGILAALESVGAESLPAGSSARDSEARAAYLERCRAVAGRPAAAWRIGVWEHSSVLRDDLVALLAELGHEVVRLGRSDEFVPVDTEAVPADVAAQIARWGEGHGLDALVSTDADGDRPLVADETGAILRGDLLGVLTGRALNATIAVTGVTANSGIEASGLFNKVLRTRVGSPYIIAGMEAAAGSGWRTVGFEANGGTMLGTPMRSNGRELVALPTREAMLPILAVIGLAQETGRTLSALAASVPLRVARSNRLEGVTPAAGQAFLESLDPGFFAEQGEVVSHDETDGLRLTLASGDVVHYRQSGNAPELRCYTEAETASRAEDLLAWGLSAARKAIGV